MDESCGWGFEEWFVDVFVKGFGEMDRCGEAEPGWREAFEEEGGCEAFNRRSSSS